MKSSIALKRTSLKPLYYQIYEQVRDQILAGELPVGAALPPSRKLANQLNVGRVTVTTAYEQLQSEGFVETVVGAGTFVAIDITLFPEKSKQTPVEDLPSLSHWGQRVTAVEDRAHPKPKVGQPIIDFGFGRSFPHVFPYDIWRKLLARYLSTDDTMLSRYGSVAGFYPLREAVADYLGRLRGVKCSPQQVIIVSGMQQALDILARLLLNSGDEILVETPGYMGAFDLFRTFGVTLTALPVDENGFPVETIPADSQARFIFVTPSNQFPRGGTMSLERRLALLQWARQTGALILEDDYDGELRYSGHPLAALQGLDLDGRVVYLGTFSKVLFPALRLGYIVLPHFLIEPFFQAMNLVDRGAPTLTQAAVADFITEGHFERHLRRLRKEYKVQRRILVKELETHLAGQLTYSSVEAGLHIMLYLAPEYDEQTVVQRALEGGIGVYAGSPYHLNPSPQPSILLGFSGLSEEEIKEGVARLARVLKAPKRE